MLNRRAYTPEWSCWSELPCPSSDAELRDWLLVFDETGPPRFEVQECESDNSNAAVAVGTSSRSASPTTNGRSSKRRACVGGPRRLGPRLIWRALDGAGNTSSSREGCSHCGCLNCACGSASSGSTEPGERVILDLCGGSGAWSRPYVEAGYDVRLVTLPDDVRLYVPPPNVWGVLAAPPCTEFSLAKNGHPRDLVRGMETVAACMRVVLQSGPRWWALENPVGLLGKFLGTPRDVFEPCDYGDPWTKRTALWGDFALPQRGPYVQPLGGGPYCTECDPSKRSSPRCNNAAYVAVTPPGFARAFFRENP